MNQYAVYSNASNAWIRSDMLSSKLSRAVTYSLGTRVIRGWDEVQRQTRKQDKSLNSNSRLSRSHDKDAAPEKSLDTSPAISEAKLDLDQEDPYEPAVGAFPEDDQGAQQRQIEHLIFAIHG
jgi:hypothetical protein